MQRHLLSILCIKGTCPKKQYLPACSTQLSAASQLGASRGWSFTSKALLGQITPSVQKSKAWKIGSGATGTRYIEHIKSKWAQEDLAIWKRNSTHLYEWMMYIHARRNLYKHTRTFFRAWSDLLSVLNTCEISLASAPSLHLFTAAIPCHPATRQGTSSSRSLPHTHPGASPVDTRRTSARYSGRCSNVLASKRLCLTTLSKIARSHPPLLLAGTASLNDT